MNGSDPRLTSLLSRATALRKEGRFDQSLPLLEEATRLTPNNAPLRHDLGLNFLRVQRAEAALAQFDRAIALDPRFGHAHFRRGIALEELGRPGALDSYRRAITLSPEIAEAHARFAALIDLTGDRRAAMLAYHQAARRGADKRQTLIWSARAATIEGDLEGAERMVRERLRLGPAASAHSLLGYLLTARGAFADAEAEVAEAIRLEPGNVGYYLGLVQTRRMRPDDAPLIERMRAALETPAPWPTRLNLHLALAKSLDDVGDYASASEQLSQVDLIRTRHQPIDRAALTGIVDRLIATFTPDRFAKISGERVQSDTPILVLGMPRSGTTLTERILASHEFVHGAGEVHFWDGAGQVFFNQMNAGQAPDLVGIGNQYLERLRRDAGGKPRIVDKNPFNFFWAGLIHLVFPEARIVHTRRDPADTCLSICLASLPVQPIFAAGRDDLLFYYRQYQRMMEHWRTVLPRNRLVEIDYEALVSDPETTIRGLLEFCGLEFQVQCLSPERQGGAIRTASAWQARQPISSASAGKRARYREFLAPFASLTSADVTDQGM